MIATIPDPETVLHQDSEKEDFEFCATHKIDHSVIVCEQPFGQFRVSVIFDVISPTHGWLTINPQMDIPKGFSSKMTLKVA